MDEIAVIQREVLGELNDFARALQRKRFSEAARAMPLAQEMIGARFGPLFEEFTTLTLLGPVRNPALDALAFEQWLLAENRAALSIPEYDALRYEIAWLTMQHTRRRLLVRFLSVRDAAAGTRRLALWWRWRGRLHHWRWDFTPPAREGGGNEE